MKQPQADQQVLTPDVIPEPEHDPTDLGEALQLPPAMMNKVLSDSDSTDLEKLNKRLAVLVKLRPQAIKMTKPQDWVKMGDKMYLQATGAERVQPLYGLVFGVKSFEREDFPDGTYAYHATMPVYSRTLGLLVGSVEGGRHSGEEFFARYDIPKPYKFKTKDEENAWKAKHRLEPSALDVRKAAGTNCEIRAVSKIAGLRNLTAEDLAAEGIEVGKVRGFQYDKGAKGGKAKEVDASGQVCIPQGFGHGGGRPITDLDDEELIWYVKALDKSIKDESKANFKAANEALVAAINKEIDLRARNKGE